MTFARVVCAATLVVASCPLFALDTGLLPYAAPDATEIAGLYVDRTVGSPLGLFLQERVGRDLDRFVRATGFDPRQHLREVVFVSGQTGSQGLVIARGIFEPAKLANSRGTHNGVELYQARFGKAWLAFPEPTIALYGDEPTVRAAIDRRRGTPTSSLDARLLEKLNTASGRYDVWFAAKGRPGLAALGIPGASGAKLDSIDVVSGGATLGATVQVTAEAVMRSESDARGLADLLKFASGMAQMQQRRNPQMSRLLGLINNAEARVEGSTVVVTTWAHETDLEQLFPQRQLKKRAQR